MKKKTNINLLFIKEKQVRETTSKLMKEIRDLKLELGFNKDLRIIAQSVTLTKIDNFSNLYWHVKSIKGNEINSNFEIYENQDDIFIIKADDEYFLMLYNTLMKIDNSCKDAAEKLLLALTI